MSALARYFNAKGVLVSGYDKTPTELTHQLTAEGIDVHFTDDISLADTAASIVVYTPAIPATHKELAYFKQQNITLLKRSDVLGIITSDTYNICVAGTHGKTTTSAMVAHVLTHSGYGCNAFLGGVASNYNTNFLQSERRVAVAEADEYDRSFLKLLPDVAIITAMDADHLDIYGTEKNMQDAFISFTGNIKAGGILIAKLGLQRAAEMQASEILTYSVDDKHADVHATNISTENGSYVFDVNVREKNLTGITLNMGGRHNIENALAAIAVAVHLQIKDEAIKAAVATFTGVKRRFQYMFKTADLVLIDDYAHHPAELEALIAGAKSLFPGWHTTVIFQPHLFSRTKDHAHGFATALSLADQVLLLPIYPAREEPMAGVTSNLIATQMMKGQVELTDKNAVLDAITKIKSTTKKHLVITAGAGDIDMLVQPLKQILETV